MTFDDADDWIEQLGRVADILADPETPHQTEDRAMLWRLLREMSGWNRWDERKLREEWRKLNAYLERSCKHAMVTYRATPGGTPEHRQCFFCNEVEWNEEVP